MDEPHRIFDDEGLRLDPVAVSAAKIMLTTIANTFNDKMFTFAELNVLYHLSNAGAVSEEQLSRSTGIVPTVLEEAIWSLLDSGFIASDDDRIELAPTGYRVLKSLHAALANALSLVLPELQKRQGTSLVPIGTPAVRTVMTPNGNTRRLQGDYR